MKRHKFHVPSISMQTLSAYFFVIPVFLALVALVVYPLLYGFFISFFRTNLSNQWKFLGLANYVSIFSTPDFIRQLLVTLKFTAVVVSAHFIVGILLAVMLNRKGRMIILFRAILVLPWLFPEVVIALIFKWIMNPLYGILNNALLSLGIIDTNISWLGSSEYAFTAVVFVCIWKGYPLIMINVLAGLQSVSADLYEAARVDGATRWGTFWHITLPSIRPVLVAALVLDTVWWFKHYTIVWLMTNGGPGNDTAIVSIDIYKQAFSYFNFGKAAAMSVVVFFVCMLISRLYRKVVDAND